MRLPRRARPAALALLACALLAPTSPAAGPRGAVGRVTVADVLAVSSHARLREMAVAKVDELTHALVGVMDAAGAARARESAELAYLELHLVTGRMRMLPRPGASESADVEAWRARMQASQARLVNECRRISADPALREPLKGVLIPLAEEMAQVGQAVASVLQTVRSQIELYRLQHGDALPDFARLGWKPLTERTTASGAFSPAGEFGPYLRVAPTNPLNGQSRLLVTRTRPPHDFRYAGGGCGFLFDASTGRIYALNADGTVFDTPSPVAAAE